MWKVVVGTFRLSLTYEDTARFTREKAKNMTTLPTRTTDISSNIHEDDYTNRNTIVALSPLDVARRLRKRIVLFREALHFRLQSF
jgi:hypothetical protein